MNLLKDGIANKIVLKTVATRKLTIDGLTQIYPVYKVKLDYLFFNDQNDRIATWISQYKTDNNGKTPDISNLDEYNNVIEKFIIESNPEAIKKTQNNIELVEQREAGVVLADGRIIDGNRRFTCLRKLAKKNPKFGYFETVILDRDINTNAKQIKILELSIQHGEESKVDYNPIDRLVGIYNDILETKLLTVQEYAASINESESDVKKYIEIAKLMVEYLEFINAPKQFYIARDLQLYTPLEDLYRLTKKCSTNDEVEDLKISVFNNILMQTVTDMSRFIRNIKMIVGSEYQEEFFEEQKELAEKVVEKLPPVGQMNISVIRDHIRTNDEIARALENSMEKTLLKVRKKESINRPIQLLEKATNFAESVDVNMILKMNDSEIRRFERQLDKLEKIVNELKENI